MTILLNNKERCAGPAGDTSDSVTRPESISCPGCVSRQKNALCSIVWIVGHVLAANAFTQRKGKVLAMAQTPSDLESPQPEARRRFQSNTLTAIFGRSVATLLTRSVLIVAVAGLLAIIAGGLLHLAPHPTSPPHHTLRWVSRSETRLPTLPS